MYTHTAGALKLQIIFAANNNLGNKMQQRIYRLFKRSSWTTQLDAWRYSGGYAFYT